ncbi:MAG: phosphatidate cytidylyltransferase [Elusimicrobiaceae bacterium]|nr:phosphatidate cytidylyltransferase [Candidatus Saccharibacteria bacterium]MBR4592797.1 phosphatidate cytidylyltransferase [Elusimicrobiaceae bacterium]
MDKNFRVRVIVGVSMFAVALVALYICDSIPFKILFGLFSLMSVVELLSFFKKKYSFYNLILAILEIGFLAYGTIFVAQTNAHLFWYIILGVPGYDVFAYLFGKLFGGKIFKKSRPFPRISKNKTWEGTILGLAMAIGLVVIKIALTGSFATDWMFILCGPLALIGDLYESYLKRKFAVKDSNEIIIKNKFFEKLEMCVGGTEGHGGFLDRIDSTAFACTILLIIYGLL